MLSLSADAFLYASPFSKNFQNVRLCILVSEGKSVGCLSEAWKMVIVVWPDDLLLAQSNAKRFELTNYFFSHSS